MMITESINNKPVCRDQDAAYVEQWLLNQWESDIIVLFDKFMKATGWKESRCNAAFHYVFYYSQRVGW